MAFDMFLKLDGVKGESRDGHGYKDQIDIYSWSWGASNAGTFGTGGGGGAGKVNMMDIAITKKLDNATGAILNNICLGKHFEKGQITVRKATGDKPLEYLVIQMEKVFVTSYQTGGSGGGDDQIMESLTLNFAKIKIKYTEQDDKGNPSANFVSGFDAQTGMKW